MINFISSKVQIAHEDIKNLDRAEGAVALEAMYKSSKSLSIDCETNGLDPYVNDILLISIANETVSFVLDRTCFDLLPKNPENFQFVAHNGKFDFGMFQVNLNFTMERIWDTMVADQKIYQGALYSPQSNPDGARMRLTDTIKRHLKYVPMYMDKDVRKKFVGQNPDNFVPDAESVLYSGTDVTYLIRIMNEQKTKLAKMGIIGYMKFIGEYIDMAAGLVELEGWTLNVPKWQKNIENNRNRKAELAIELDDTVRELRDTLLTKDERRLLTAGKFDRKRKDASVTQMGLFGESKEVDATKTKAYMNWNSTLQITDLFARFKFELPNGDKKNPFAIPKLIRKVSKGNVIYEIEKTFYPFTTKKDEVATMLLDNPDTAGKPLLIPLLKYRNADHEISSFGQNWIDSINPVSKRVHTRFRTDTAETGRFQSGESGSRFLNHQNVPAKMEFRGAFTVDTKKYSVATNDLAGAEVTIMCDKAHDLQLYEWAVKEDDAHSPIAQLCWRNVYLYRAGLLTRVWNTPKDFWRAYNSYGVLTLLTSSSDTRVIALLELSKTFTISKMENVLFRTKFKAITFGAVYGMFAGKCAKVLGITKDEATVVLDTIKKSIPKTFNYVEGCVEFAMQNGYLPLDERTGSRVLFPAIIEVLKRKEIPSESNLSWKILHDVEGAARNYTIQGTQASMIKEAMCEIQLWNLAHKFDAGICCMVHDELNTRQPRAYDGVNGDLTVLWVSDKAKVLLQPKELIIKPVIVDHRLHDKTKETLIEKQLALRVSYPEFVRLTMIEVANRYLKHFKMGAATQVADTWVK